MHSYVQFDDGKNGPYVPPMPGSGFQPQETVVLQAFPQGPPSQGFSVQQPQAQAVFHQQAPGFQQGYVPPQQSQPSMMVAGGASYAPLVPVYDSAYQPPDPTHKFARAVGEYRDPVWALLFVGHIILLVVLASYAFVFEARARRHFFSFLFLLSSSHVWWRFLFGELQRLGLESRGPDTVQSKPPFLINRLS